MAVRPVRTVALCAGAGALELGVSLALGGRTSAVAYVERDPFAAAVLVARMEDEALGRAPVWDDVATFDGAPFRGRVDLITAGFPCQPFSAAGRRQGLDDERWLWPHVARVVGEVGPDFVFVENVRGFLAEHGGLGAVLGDLADLGFDAEWQVLSAAALGATQKRERFWLLAHRHGARLESLGSFADESQLTDAWRGSYGMADSNGGRRGSDGFGRQGREPEPAHVRPPVEHASGSRRPEVAGGAHGDEAPDEGWAAIDGHEPDGAGEDVADTAGKRRCGWNGRGERRRWPPSVGGEACDLAAYRRGPFPPAPDDLDEWAIVLADDPTLEPAVHRMADGLACRVERSHLIGNGVVPLVAAAAFLALARRAGVVSDTAHSDGNGGIVTRALRPE